MVSFQETGSTTAVAFPIWQEEVGRVCLLSSRETEVFVLLGRGRSNRAISTELDITERTVKAHVAHIMAKLRVESRLQAGLASYAYQLSRPADTIRSAGGSQTSASDRGGE